MPNPSATTARHLTTSGFGTSDRRGPCTASTPRAWSVHPDAAGPRANRSADNEGILPLFGVETKLDSDLIFKMTLKQRQKDKNLERAGDN